MHHRFFHRLRLALFFLCLSLGISFAHAQNEEDENSDLDQIEAEIEKSAQKTPVRPSLPGATTTAPEPQSLSDLGKLAPFSEVSVLQKRYMPKTERFQVSLGLGGIMNDPWFYGLGGSLRLGYHFSESWGIEGTYTFLSSSERDSAKDLFDNNKVSTNSIVTTKGYMGADVVWSPIYGKMSLLNKRIIPFDMYFTAGMGQSQLDGATSSSATAIHVGTGQIYALSKSWGFRWDFSWNTYSATPSDKGATTQFNNLILTLGTSFFFPEAKYR
jgi:outer membrane beta-barrel protein